MAKLKILQINKFFYPRGGAEVYMLTLSQMLRKQGHQVIEFSMKHPENIESPYKEYFVDQIDLSQKQGLWQDIKKAGHLIYSTQAAKNLDKLLTKEKPDIAHLHNFYFHLTPSIIKVLKKHQIPVVWTMHDYKLICPNYKLFTQGNICERCKVYKYYNCLKYKCIKDNSAFSFLAMIESYLHNWLLKSYQQIDLYISPSQFLKDKVCQWGIKPAQVKHIYNFIDLDKFQPLDGPGQGIVYFGRLSEEKGLMSLVKAMAKLPEYDLQVIGDGPQKQEISDFIKENKLTNIELVGYKKGQELYDLVRKARIVVLPSVWYENNPISILESFALAKPVIGTKLGGIPELIKEGQTGFLVEPNNTNSLEYKIKSVYDQQDLLQQISQNCYDFAHKQFNSQKHLDQLLAVYQQVIDQQ